MQIKRKQCVYVPDVGVPILRFLASGWAGVRFIPLSFLSLIVDAFFGGPPPWGKAILLKAQGDYKKSALSDKAHTMGFHATGLRSSQVEVLSCLTIKVGVQGRMTTSLKRILRYPLMLMILLLTLSLLSVSPCSPPGISRTPPSSTGETIVAGL
jgi:hypothetical protein